MNNKTSSYATIVFILMSAFLLRMPAVFLTSMTGDEISTKFQADFPFEKMILRLAETDFANADIAPPFYYILLNGFLSLFPFTVWGARLLSTVFDLLTIWLTYYYMRREGLGEVAPYAALFIAFSPFHVWYAAEIRMYALVPLLALCSTFCYNSFLRKGSFKYLIAYWLFSTLGIYTQYYFFLLILAQCIAAFCFMQRSLLIKYAVAVLGVGLAFLPWLKALLIDINILKTNPFSAQGTFLFTPIYVVLKLFFFGNRFFVMSFLPLYALGSVLILAVGILFIKNIRKNPSLMNIIALLVILSILIISSILFIKPQTFRPHAAIFLVPLCLVITAYGTTLLNRWGSLLRILFFVLWACVLVLYNYNPLYTKSRVREGAEIVCQLNEAKYPVINLPLQIPCTAETIPGSYQLWEYYLQTRCSVYLLRGNTSDELYHNLGSLVGDYPKFILVYFDYIKPPDFYRELRAKIDLEYRVFLTEEIPSKVDSFPIKIIVFERKGEDQESILINNRT